MCKPWTSDCAGCNGSKVNHPLVMFVPEVIAFDAFETSSESSDDDVDEMGYELEDSSDEEYFVDANGTCPCDECQERTRETAREMVRELTDESEINNAEQQSTLLQFDNTEEDDVFSCGCNLCNQVVVEEMEPPIIDSDTSADEISQEPTAATENVANQKRKSEDDDAPNVLKKAKVLEDCSSDNEEEYGVPPLHQTLDDNNCKKTAATSSQKSDSEKLRVEMSQKEELKPAEPINRQKRKSTDDQPESSSPIKKIKILKTTATEFNDEDGDKENVIAGQ